MEFLLLLLLIFDVFVSGCGEGTRETPPESPSRLQVSLFSPSQITLSWIDYSRNEEGFKIERKTKPSDTYAPLAKVGADVNTYQDKGLATETTYYYRAYAYNSGGNSSYSNEVSATTLVPSGNKEWEYRNNYNCPLIYTSPILDQKEGKIFIGASAPPMMCFVGNCSVTCLDSINLQGEKLWEIQKGGIFSAPAIDEGGNIYVSNYETGLYAISVTGTEKWNYSGNGLAWPLSSPALGNNGSIYASVQNSFYKLDREGNLIWTYSPNVSSLTDGFFFTSPALNEQEELFVGASIMLGSSSNKSKLLSFKNDGALKWEFELEEKYISSPVIGENGVIYITSTDGSLYFHLYAVSPEGEEKWQIILGDTYLDSNHYISSPYPAIGEDGTIYVGGSDAELYAINPDGTIKWKFPSQGMILSSPLIGADGTIYAGSSGSGFYALDPDGTLKWEMPPPAGETFWFHPVLADNGVLYIVYTNQNNNAYNSGLLAINTSSPGLANSPWPMFGHDPRNTSNQSTKFSP